MAMTYNIPQDMWFRVQDSTSDIVEAGNMETLAENKLLSAIKVGFLKHNCNGVFKLRLHTSKNYSRIYAESAPINFALIKEAIITGQVKFDFADISLIKNTKYYMTIQAVTYTRVADTNYIAWLHDRDFTTNVSTGNYANEFPLRLEMFVK
jgi:hypothetical protein